jgi:hypothetical protein
MAADTAGRFVGQFDAFGLSIGATRDIIQDTINEAGQYGISSGKLVNSIGKNIDKVNKYNFKNGVKGLVEMTKYSERFKIDMEGTFSAMDKSRTLEGSLDMASKLMVMGGKFSESDPFKLMFLSRNDPAKFQEALNKMTEGVAVFNKTTKQFEVGAYDMDRLRVVAEATGQNYENLVEQSKRFAQIKMAKNQLFVGNKEEKDMIATIAKIGDGGKFQIDVGGVTKDLSKLTSEDIKMLKQQEKTLEQRAKDAQNFDATLKSLVLEFKSTFLPILQFTNEALKKFKSVIDGTRDFFGGSFGKLAAFTVGAGLLLSAGLAIAKAFTIGKTLVGSLTGGGGSAAGTATAAASKGVGGSAITTGAGASAAGTGANYARAASIAAIGVAAVGIGYGINLAAKGFAYLGETMGKLDLKTQNKLLGAMMITFAGMAGLILAAGYAGTAALPGLLGIAAAVSSIGLAAGGVGYLVDKLNNFVNPEAKMVEAVKNVDFQPMKSAFAEANRFLSADLGNLTSLRKELDNIKEIDFSQTKKLISTLSNGVELKLPKGTELTMTINNIIDIDGEQIVKKNTRTVMLEITNSKRGRGSLSM